MEQSALTISLQSLVALFEYLDGEKKRLAQQINTLAMTQTYASRVAGPPALSGRPAQVTQDLAGF